MVVERSSGDLIRSDVLGYAQFTQHMEAGPTFARWSQQLDTDVKALLCGGHVGVRMILTQRALIALIDFFDPERIRFPDLNERGRIPLPPGYEDRKRLRPPSEIARFRFEGDPFAQIEPWAREHDLTATWEDASARVRLSKRRLHSDHDLVILHPAPWVEVHVVPRGQHPNRSPDIGGRLHVGDQDRSFQPRRSEIDSLNALLQRFDRPLLQRKQHRSRH